jgi:putative colanic acid biosynthesis acetyltransferase WcaF
MNVRLSQFNNSWYDPGRGLFGRTLWYFANALVLRNPFNPFSWPKAVVLRVFGAKIGHGVVLKPCINIKYPWNIDIGNDSWIGENAWLDSLALIKIGSNVCVSQGAYLCTGNHDWSDPAFGLVVKTIVVEDGAWIGAMATVPPGVTIASHSVVTAGSVIVEDTEPYGIYAGNPAVKIKDRKIR